MKKIVLLVIAAAVTMLFGGCTIVSELPRATRKNESAAPEHELCRQLLIKFIKNDAKGFISTLPESSRGNFTEELFKTTRKKLVDSIGEPVSFTHLTDLEFATFKPQVWVVRFRRYDRKMEKSYTSEALFKIVTGTLDGKLYVLSFNFL